MPALIALLSTSAAATLTVDPTDSTAYATIQDAIAAAVSGDELLLSAGTFAECVDLGGKDLSLVGEGHGSTTMDGEGCEVVLTATAGEAVVIEGLTLTNAGPRCVLGEGGALTLSGVTLSACGDGSANGSAVHMTRGDLALYDVGVEQSLAEFRWSDPSAAVHVEDDSGTASVELWESRFVDNGDFGLFVEGAADVAIDSSVFEGGDLAIGALLVMSTATATMTGTTVSGFSFGNGFESGTAIAAFNSVETLDIDGSAFTDNDTSRKDSAGGVLLLQHVEQAVVRGSTFSNNHSSAYSHHDTRQGTALVGYFGTALWVLDSAFDGNTGAQWGGAVFVSGSELVVIAGNHFLGNEAEDWGSGGAAVMDGLYGGALLVHDNLFCSNQADNRGSAVVVPSTWPDALFSHNRFIDNSGGESAIALYDGVTLVHNAVVGTQAELGALWAYEPLALTNNLVGWTTGGSGVIFDDPDDVDDSTLAYNNWFDNESGHIQDGAVDPADFDGSVLEDPLLVGYRPGCDCLTQDLALRSTSPLVDAGDPDWADGDGSAADMGPTGALVDSDGDCFVVAIDTDDGDPAVHPGDDVATWPFGGTPCEPDDGMSVDEGSDGGADTGTADGGDCDGGSSDGGTSDGGTTDGASTDGASTDGGSTDGGGTDGGSTDGGTTDGGDTGDDVEAGGDKKGCSTSAGMAMWVGWLLAGTICVRRRRGAFRHATVSHGPVPHDSVGHGSGAG